MSARAARPGLKTLVLNAGYEPMSVVSYRRAIVLLLSEKASLLAVNSERVIHSERLDMEQPSVILLTRYVRPPHSKGTVVSRRGVLRRDKHRCGYCGSNANTVDHILPRSRGGANTWLNLVACCRTCNNRKGDACLDEIGWKLRVQPHEPSGRSWWLPDLEDPHPSWRPFLELTAVA